MPTSEIPDDLYDEHEIENNDPWIVYCLPLLFEYDHLKCILWCLTRSLLIVDGDRITFYKFALINKQSYLIKLGV